MDYRQLTVKLRTHWLWPPAMAVVGVWISYRGVVGSGLQQMAGDFGDTRLVNYVLEHSYRWLQREPLHRSFWDSPYFYRTPNATAFTETLLGAAPIYWVLRLLGCAPDTACQIWALILLLLGFGAFYLFLRRGFAFDRMSSAFGAGLFEFSSVRVAQLNHQQLLPQLFMIAALFALIRIFSSETVPPSRFQTRTWISVFVAASILQLYASLYLGWFLFLGLGAAVGITVGVPRWRDRFFTVLRANIAWIVGCAAGAALVLYPLVAHSLAAVTAVRVGGYAAIAPMVPGWAAWTYLGTDNWLYGSLARVGPWNAVTESGYAHELSLGLGFVTTGIVVWGLVSEGRNERLRVFSISALVIVFCVTRLSPGVTPWEILGRLLPGAFAIRALSRIGLLLLIPAGLGLAAFLQRRRSTAVALLAGLVCMAEQLRDLPSFDKLAIRADVAAIAEAVDPDRCGYFYLSPRNPVDHVNWKSQLDAMWAGLEIGVPTVNGWSGYPPTQWDWRLLDNAIDTPQDERELERALRSWIATRALDPAGFCWIQP